MPKRAVPSGAHEGLGPSCVGAAGGNVGVGEQPALLIAVFAGQSDLALLCDFGFASVIDGSRAVLEVSVVVEDAGEEPNRFAGAVRDPVAVAGEGVVVQELVEVAAGPAMFGWLGQNV